jgi:hypothetical protein
MRGLRSKVAADERVAIDERVATPNHATATPELPHRTQAHRTAITSIIVKALFELRDQGSDLPLPYFRCVAIEYLCNLLRALTLRKVALDQACSSSLSFLIDAFRGKWFCHPIIKKDNQMNWMWNNFAVGRSDYRENSGS